MSCFTLFDGHVTLLWLAGLIMSTVLASQWQSGHFVMKQLTWFDNERGVNYAWPMHGSLYTHCNSDENSALLFGVKDFSVYEDDFFQHRNTYLWLGRFSFRCLCFCAVALPG